MTQLPAWFAGALRLYVSAPAGNAIQAFGYGADDTQNKNSFLPAPPVMDKDGSDWTTATSEPPLVTMPKVTSSSLRRLWLEG